ncbi:MAG: IS630 family transposase [Deltaproteobacteria bacterium]|nr:IS630 family transposase [Deltaproteobacteria bacterium]
MVRASKTGQLIALRARIIVLLGDGFGPTAVARRVGCSPRVVRKWQRRWLENPRPRGLHDAGRTGRPGRVPVTVRLELVRLACERPDDQKAPFRDVWTYAALADAVAASTGFRLSVSEVGRILRFELLRPHHVKQWLHSSDPDFTSKAERVSDIYLNPPRNAVVVCVDEKPLQALERIHDTHVGDRARVRYEFEYKRHGTSALLAAFDTRTGHVVGHVVRRRTAAALLAFMREIARRHPRRPIYVVWDNLNIHYDGKDNRWTEFNARHGGRFHFIYTPKHASWLNQIEIWFSILQRRILRYGSFKSREELSERVLAFIAWWNEEDAHPFRWTWRTDRAQDPRRREDELPRAA